MHSFINWQEERHYYARGSEQDQIYLHWVIGINVNKRTNHGSQQGSDSSSIKYNVGIVIIRLLKYSFKIQALFPNQTIEEQSSSFNDESPQAILGHR